MTVQEARNAGLRLWGFDDATVVASSLPSMLEDLAIELTGTLQELYTLGPSWLREKDMSPLVYGPRTLTGKAIDQYAVQFTADTGTAVTDSMVGCSAEVAGNGLWLTLASADAAGVGATTRDPFMGPSVTGAQVIVYGDAIPLSEPFGIREPVYLHPGYEGRFTRHQLTAINDRKEWQEYVWRYRNTTTDTPRWYFVEWHDNAMFLRLLPWPDQAYQLHFQGELIPRTYTADNLTTGHVDNLLAQTIAIPSNMAATVFLPIFKYRLTEYAHFNNDEIVPRLEKAREQAYIQLSHMDPQKERELCIKPGF